MTKWYVNLKQEINVIIQSKYFVFSTSKNLEIVIWKIVILPIWKERKHNNTLFSLKEFEILHQERVSQVNTTVMEHFSSILFLKSGPANKQHIYGNIRIDLKEAGVNAMIWSNWSQDRDYYIISKLGSCGILKFVILLTVDMFDILGKRQHNKI